jgi:hypothetical protein
MLLSTFSQHLGSKENYSVDIPSYYSEVFSFFSWWNFMTKVCVPTDWFSSQSKSRTSYVKIIFVCLWRLNRWTDSLKIRFGDLRNVIGKFRFAAIWSAIKPGLRKNISGLFHVSYKSLLRYFKIPHARLSLATVPVPPFLSKLNELHRMQLLLCALH